jgi:hypothetical protein
MHRRREGSRPMPCSNLERTVGLLQPKSRVSLNIVHLVVMRSFIAFINVP